MRRLIKQAFCKHRLKEPYNQTRIIDGRLAKIYRLRCKQCGKVWKL